MKKFLIILILFFIIIGCDNYENRVDINKIMQENEYVIVDVRTEEEYETSHVVGSINIPYDQIGINNDLDKDKVIFVYCQSGRRSNVAFETLTKLGYTVYDLGAFADVALPKE